MAHKGDGDIQHIEFRLHGVDPDMALAVYNVLRTMDGFFDAMDDTVGKAPYAWPEFYVHVAYAGAPIYFARAHRTKTGKEVYEIWIHKKHEEVTR